VFAVAPLVRIVLRRGKRTWFDVGLAGVCLIAAHFLPSILHSIRNVVLTYSGYPASEPSYNRMPLDFWLQTRDLVMLNVVWMIVDLFLSHSAKKRTECATIYVSAVIVALMMLGGCYYPTETGRLVQCRNNLTMIGLAFHNYHDAFQRFPALAEREGLPVRSWRVDVLPYMDNAPLRRQYVDAAAWDSPQNLPLAKQVVPALQCPSDPNRTLNGQSLTGYAGVRGANTMFPDGRGRAIREVTDGTSNTLLIVEACGRQIVWTAPRDVDLSEQKVGVNLPGEQPGRSRAVISGYHRGGHVLMGDGSVRFTPENIDPDVLRAAITATGGEAGAVGW